MTCLIRFERSLTTTLPPVVQQSLIFCCRFSSRVLKASDARCAVRSSFMKILASGCPWLCSFSFDRARNTESRRRSARKRTMMGRFRGRPSLSFGGPMRCARSTSVRASGGVNPIVSLINNTTFCSVVPFVSSGIPWIRRFGRLEYCSWQSTSSSRV